MKQIHISYAFYRSELVQDICNAAYFVGTSAGKTDKEIQELKDVFQSVGTETGNTELPTRMMDMAFSKCCNILGGWMKNVPECKAQDDQYAEADAYSMTLTPTREVSDSIVDYLKNLIHKFICYRTLFEYCLLTMPDAAQNLLAIADETEKEIKSVMGQGKSGLRPMFPF